MSELPSGSASSSKSQGYNEALLKARQIAEKIKSDASGTNSLKRPVESDFGEGPQSKKPASAAVNDPYGAQIASRMMMSAGAGAPPVAGMDQASTEIIMVPDKMVGLIIGRGGEQITRLQAEAGCKIQMAPDSGGLPDRQCTLTGAPSSIAQAKAAIDRIISNEGNGAPRPGMGGPAGGGGGFFEMMVPGQKVGLIIGKGGEMIKNLQEQSGAKIVIIQDTPEAALEKPLRITGTPEGVETAKGLVMDILNQSDDRDPMGFGGRGRGRGGMRGVPRGGFGLRGGRGGGRGGFGGGGWNGAGGGEYGAQHVDYVQVPANKCGLIIGKGGETIKNINSTSGAHCEVDKNAPPDAREKNFVIRGSVEAVAQAKSMILEKLGISGGGYGGGGYGGSWGGADGYQQPGYESGGVNVNPQTGQPDYSTQWVDYYRSMGMHEEANAIEAARRGGAGGPTQAPGGAPAANGGAANGQADYSAQWAEYYRSIGKVKEAEAIEAQMKNKTSGGGAPPNPGGAGGPPAGQAYGQGGYPGFYNTYVSQ